MPLIDVMLVDDSKFTRHILSKHLEDYPDIHIVGEAHDGREALKLIPQLKPDVVILDVAMRYMDGLTTLRRIMAECPTAVIMLSSLTQKSAQTTIQALMSGALAFVPKPSGITDISEVVEDLVAKIRLAAHTPHLAPQIENVVLPAIPQRPAKQAPQPFLKGDPLVIIGASAGGPRALHQLITALPSDFPAAVVIVQHMLAPFTTAMAQRLHENSELVVQEAVHEQSLARGLVLVAPADFHLRFDDNKHVILDKSAKQNSVRPAVDVTMESAAKQHGKSTIGIILTGMGHDGTVGAEQIKTVAGTIIAEHESSCLIYGMPRSVIEAGLADQVLPANQIASALVDMVTWKTTNTSS